MTNVRDILRGRTGGTSFRGRLLALLVAVSIVQVVAAAITYNGLQSKPVEDRVRAELVAALQTASPIIKEQLDAAAAELEGLAGNAELTTAMREGDVASIQAITAAEGDPAETGIWITDADGADIVGSEPTVPYLDASANVSSGAQFFGSIHVPVAFDESFFEEVANFTGTRVFVADADSVVTADVKREDSVPTDVDISDEERPEDLTGSVPQITIQGEVDGRDVVPPVTDEGVVTNVEVLPEDTPEALAEDMQRVEMFGEEQIAFARPLGTGTELLFGASIPADTVDGLLDANRGKLIMFILLMLALAITVSVMITRSVGAVLRVFVGGTERVAEGALDERLPVHGNDELAVLSSSFNTMAENLQERVESLVEARQRLRRQVEHFGKALENAHNIEEMLLAVCTVAIESTAATHARFWTVDDDGEFTHAACIGLRPRDKQPCDLERFAAGRDEMMATNEAPYWLAIPVEREGVIVGVLTLVSIEESFSTDGRQLARRLAAQAALALENARMHETLRQQASIDALTGLPNHRTMQEHLSRMMEEASVGGGGLGLAMLDVDNFKSVNDTYGHKIGDDALKGVAAALRNVTAAPTLVARYGGEEFCVLMPGVDSAAAVRIADRVRQEIERIEVPLDDGGVLRITASFGVSNFDLYNGELPAKERFFEDADHALYAAKHGGKNRVELHQPNTSRNAQAA